MGKSKKSVANLPGQFVGYFRVSTQRQGESGLGLDAQRSAVARYLQGKGAIVPGGEYVEIESGKRDDRPQLAAALAHCKRVGAVLVIAKLDRLARKVSFISRLMEDSSEFVAVDMPAANRFVLHVMAAVAEAEREAISSRTKAGMAAIKDEIARQGFRISKRSGRKFERLGNPRWQESIAQARASKKCMQTPNRVRGMIIAWRREGKSIQKIADALNELGIRTALGSKWHSSTVWSELQKAMSMATLKATA